MNALKRETTIANRFPRASRLPAIAGTSGSGGCSSLMFLPVLTSVSLCPCGAWGFHFCNLTSASLLALELRRPLRQKRRSPFLLILGRAANAKQRCFQIQPLGQRHLH